MSLHTQLMTMIAMMLGGVYLGFATDTYRRIVYRWRETLVARYIVEIVYWLTQTGLLFYLLFQVNDGEIRFYVFLACLLGYSMYVVFCMPWYRKLVNKVIHVGKVVIHWVFDGLYFLLVQPLLWIGKLILSLLLFIYKVVIKLLYFCLYPFLWLLKRYLPPAFYKKISQIPLICSTMIRNTKKRWKKVWKKWR